MPAQTPVRKFPYPVGTDPIDNAGDLQRLAEAFDNAGSRMLAHHYDTTTAPTTSLSTGPFTWMTTPALPMIVGHAYRISWFIAATVAAGSGCIVSLAVTANGTPLNTIQSPMIPLNQTRSIEGTAIYVATTATATFNFVTTGVFAGQTYQQYRSTETPSYWFVEDLGVA